MHDADETIPIPVEYVPDVQYEQTDIPVPVEYIPAEHDWHAVDEFRLYMPCKQGMAYTGVYVFPLNWYTSDNSAAVKALL